MNARRKILRRQRAWARSAGLKPDTRGFLDSVDGNLYRPLSAAARKAFEQGNGLELSDTPARPAKLKALHSSAALAANVFDHWANRDAKPLLNALGLDSSLVSLRFEAQFATGLPGNPPNPDVALELEDGRVVSIESKFTEWLTPKRKGRPAFKEKYFENGSTFWANAGLPKLQALAEDLMSGKENFRYLDAPQLLKHALGLATQHPCRGRLLYLYLDADGPAGSLHRDETARFAARADDALGCRAISYQDLIERLHREPDVDAGYLAYLRSRYTPQVKAT